MSISLNTVSLDQFSALVDSAPDKARRAASLAINDTARKYRTIAKREMLKQVAWPSSYLGNATEGRLQVSRFSSPTDLNAAITGRWQPTSLARFAKNRPSNARAWPRGRSIQIMIKPGTVRQFDHAFFLNLKNGNLGLAVRVKSDDELRGSTAARLIFPHVYLLYGPSVNQVFRGVSKDLVPGASLQLAQEFNRQFTRLTNG